MAFVIELSAYPHSMIRHEVAIFIFNVLISGKDQVGALLLEKDVLYALGNIIN